MSNYSELPGIGDRIEINSLVDNTKRAYISQVLDILNEKHFIIAGPLYKNSIVPLHVGNILEVKYYKKGKGRFVFKGKVLERELNNIYRIKLERISEIIKLQQRNFFRLQVNVDVTKQFKTNDNDTEKELVENCKIKDISGGGLKIFCNYEHRLDDEIKCIFILDKIEYTLKCKVVRIEKSGVDDYKYSIGVRFISINDDERDNIIKYVFETQRKLRKKGLI